MTAPASTNARARRSPGFVDTLASEWLKLRSLRSTYIMAGLAVFLSILATALIGLAIGSTYDDWSPSEQADFDPILFSINGVIVTIIIFSVFGVLAASSEYSSGMIRTTFTVTPNRSRVLAAKIVLVAIVTALLGTAATVGMFYAGQAVFAGFDMQTATLDSADSLRAVFGLGVSGAVYPIIGLCIGVLLRSTAGGITAILALIWIPEILAPLLPQWWQANVMSLLPGAALDSVVVGHLMDSETLRDPLRGAVVSIVWLVLFIGAAAVMVNRRDA